MYLCEGVYRTVGCHVPCAGEGAEEAASGDRGCADVGLCGPSEAAHGCQDSSVGAAARASPEAIL